jgi:protocatechuate 3,4-dioxygenase beta subunit
MGMLTRKIVMLMMLMFPHWAGEYTCTAQINEEIKIESRSTGQGYALCGSCTLPKNISSHVRLVSRSEPGEPITLSGTIYKDDGVTPDSGVILFVYQTDAGGFYHRPEENVFHPRIAGWLAIGNDGRYEIQTIRPAPEILAAKEPAHIHVHIFGNGMPEHFLHEFWFQGDSRIPEEGKTLSAQLGNFSPIVTLTKGKDGVARGVRNIRVRPAPAWKYERD